MTEGRVADEGLHLAVALQYCSFRIVVGTNMGNGRGDGRKLAERLFKALFSTPPEENKGPTAQALRFGMKKLRRERQFALRDR